MTDILSPSPYADLDALTPAERQAEIARRQHSRREDWCDDARRARDYQAELAEALQELDEALEAEQEMSRIAADAVEARAAALARIAELEAALREAEAALEDSEYNLREAREETP